MQRLYGLILFGVFVVMIPQHGSDLLSYSAVRTALVQRSVFKSCQILAASNNAGDTMSNYLRLKLIGFGRDSRSHMRRRWIPTVAAQVSHLEDRLLLSVGVDGWTELEPSPDSRMIYVSSSTGNDANNGLTPNTPKKTLTAGNLLMRDGSPDWLLLKRGDVWSDQSIYWKTSGNSPVRKSVLSSYGDGARPVLKNGAFRYLESTPLRHLAIVGLDFYASYNDPASPDFSQGVPLGTGIQITPTTADDLLLEDNRVRFYDTNVQIRRVNAEPLITNVSIRRNMISDAQSFGLLVTWVDGVLLEQNTFDKCGWENRTKFLHDVYAKEDRNFIARGNIFSRGGNFGLKISADHKESFSDFVVEDNLFYQSAFSIGHSAGATDYDPMIDVGTIDGIVNRNVFLSPGKLLPFNSTSAQTFAIMLQNLANVSFDSNVFTHNSEYQNTGEALGMYSSEKSADITVTKSAIYDWHSNYYNNFGSYFKDISIVDGFVESDNFPANVQYADPGRDLTTYSISLGGAANNEAYLLRSSEQSRADWDLRYTAKAFNDYIRGGFARVLATPVFSTPSNSTTSNALSTVSWSTVNGADSYDVWYSNLTTGQNPAFMATAATASYTPATALPIGQYQIWVRATQNGGPSSPWSSPITLRVNSPPTLNSLPTDGADARPQLTWTSVPGAVRYEVRGDNLTTGAKSVVSAKNVAETSFTPGSDLGFSVFRFWVRGFDAKSVSTAWSVAQDYSRAGVTTLVQPVVFDGLNSVPTITWNGISGAARYELWVSNLTTGENAIIRNAEIPGSSFVPIQSLPFGTNRFWVRAFDAAGMTTKWSESLDAVNAPALLTPVAPTFERRPTFTWAALPGVSSSEVYISINGTVIKPKGLLGASWTPESDLPVGNLKWWVRHKAPNGVLGPWSARAETYIGGRSAILAAGVPGNDPARIGVFAWQAVTGASRYILHVERIGVGVVILESNLTSTSYTTSAPLAAGAYRAWIKAIDASDNVTGIWSNAFAFTVVGIKSDERTSPVVPQLATGQLESVLSDERLVSIKHLVVPNTSTAPQQVIRPNAVPADREAYQNRDIETESMDEWTHPKMSGDALMSEHEADRIDKLMADSSLIMMALV